MTWDDRIFIRKPCNWHLYGEDLSFYGSGVSTIGVVTIVINMLGSRLLFSMNMRSLKIALSRSGICKMHCPISYSNNKIDLTKLFLNSANIGIKTKMFQEYRDSDSTRAGDINFVQHAQVWPLASQSQL